MSLGIFRFPDMPPQGTLAVMDGVTTHLPPPGQLAFLCFRALLRKYPGALEMPTGAAILQ